MFFVAFGIGNWNQNTLRLMFNQFEDRIQQPTFKRKLHIYSDGNDDYKTVIPEYYNEDCICHGQKVKSKNGKKLDEPIRRKVFGNPDWQEIDTNTNESFNSVLRGKLARLVRKTKYHSKDKIELKNGLSLFQFYWNFMHESRKNVTPAIMEKQATKVWIWGSLLHAKLKYLN